MVEEKLCTEEKVVNHTIAALSSMGVDLISLDISNNTPIFYISINKLKFDTIDDLLNSVYWVLWTLVYGKQDDSNKDLSIELKYKVIGGDSTNDNN